MNPKNHANHQRPSRQERRLKFAEAGILFVLVLGLVVFVGVKVASHGEDEAMTMSTATAQIAEAAQVRQEPTTEPSETSASPSDPMSGTELEITEAVSDEVVSPTPEAAQPLAVEPPSLVTYAEAEQAYLSGNYEEAADLFARYTGRHTVNAWGHYMLGLASWKSGDPEGAEEAFLAALEIKPDHQKSLINYGRVLLELDRPQEARQQVELALTNDPENLDATRVLGRIYHELGMLDEATDSYRQVLRSKGDDAWSLNNLGLILIQQERFHAALPALAKASALKPEVACIQNNLGVALERTGHYRAAGSAYEMAINAGDGSAKAEESRERVLDLKETGDQADIDLAELAERFHVDMLARRFIATEPDTASGGKDMEVAAAAGQVPTPTTDDAEPDTD